jgi:hypothetical protein
LRNVDDQTMRIHVHICSLLHFGARHEKIQAHTLKLYASESARGLFATQDAIAKSRENKSKLVTYMSLAAGIVVQPRDAHVYAWAVQALLGCKQLRFHVTEVHVALLCITRAGGIKNAGTATQRGRRYGERGGRRQLDTA